MALSENVSNAVVLEDVHKIIVEGMREALTSAGSRGWEAQMMVVVIICMLLYFVYDKWLTNRRESQMSARIASLETFVETTLIGMVRESSKVLEKTIAVVDTLSKSLNTRLCLLDPTQQRPVVDRMADRIGEHIIDQRRQTDA
jgi:hypothetical protein